MRVTYLVHVTFRIPVPANVLKKFVLISQLIYTIKAAVKVHVLFISKKKTTRNYTIYKRIPSVDRQSKK